MKQTLTISVKTSASGKIQDEVATIVHSHEPDVKVSEQTDSYVTKKYLLKGLDCPNCSAKIEKEVGELEGVALSEVNLMKQTLMSVWIITRQLPCWIWLLRLTQP